MTALIDPNNTRAYWTHGNEKAMIVDVWRQGAKLLFHGYIVGWENGVKRDCAWNADGTVSGSENTERDRIVRPFEEKFRVLFPEYKEYVTRDGRIASIHRKGAVRPGVWLGPNGPTSAGPRPEKIRYYGTISGLNNEYLWDENGKSHDDSPQMDLVDNYGTRTESKMVETKELRVGTRVKLEGVVEARAKDGGWQIRLVGAKYRDLVVIDEAKLKDVVPPPTFEAGDVVKWKSGTCENQIVFCNAKTAIFAGRDGELFPIPIDELSLDGSVVAKSIPLDR